MSKELLRTNEAQPIPPGHEVITAIGRVRCDWSNSNLIRHYDPYDNYLEYNDGNTLHKLNMLDDDWDKLVKDHWPWEYWPDMRRFEESDFLSVDVGQERYEFRPHNTKLRYFPGNEKYNHIEHQVNPQITQGITVVPALWRMMFRGDYPIKALPYVDADTIKWYKDLHT